jgi:hypothetical protein
MLNVALQAKMLDEVASGFIRTTQPRSGSIWAPVWTPHVRLAPPDTVDWSITRQGSPPGSA